MILYTVLKNNINIIKKKSKLNINSDFYDKMINLILNDILYFNMKIVSVHNIKIINNIKDILIIYNLLITELYKVIYNTKEPNNISISNSIDLLNNNNNTVIHITNIFLGLFKKEIDFIFSYNNNDFINIKKEIILYKYYIYNELLKVYIEKINTNKYICSRCNINNGEYQYIKNNENINLYLCKYCLDKYVDDDCYFYNNFDYFCLLNINNISIINI